MQSSFIKRVGILRGGTGNQHASSVRKGGDIISHIFENLSDKYKTVDIFIDKNGNWHVNGLPIIPADLVRKVDIVWDISEHPNSSITLDDFSIPNMGRGHFLKVLENSNDILRKHIKEIGVQMPRFMVLPVFQKDFDGPQERYAIKKAKEVFEKFSSPWVVKSYGENNMGPVRGREGSQRPSASNGMGIHLAKTFGELSQAIEDGVAHGKSILVEEFIAGKPSTVHSISGFRGEDIYVLPPQNFSTNEKEKIITFAKNLHKHLATEYYLKSDFILHPKRGFFLTNIESLPDLRKGSHFEQSCQYVGAEIHHVLEHILEKTLNKKK